MMMGLRLNTTQYTQDIFKPNGSAKYGTFIGGHYDIDAAKPVATRNCMLPLVVRIFLAALDDEILQCISISIRSSPKDAI